MRPRLESTKDWAYGWHWRPNNGTLQYRDPRLPKVGEMLVARTKAGRPVNKPGWCRPGFHAARSLKDACEYKSYGRLLSFVMIGDAQFYRKQSKFVGRTRTILWEALVPKSIWKELHRCNGRSQKTLIEWMKAKGFKPDNARALGRRRRKAAAK